jgi:hypothetical protein
MTYCLTYTMTTGQGARHSSSAKDAVVDHARLLHAGATGIIIRDEQCFVVTLAAVEAIGRLIERP